MSFRMSCKKMCVFIFRTMATMARETEVFRDVAIPYEDTSRNKALPDFYTNEISQIESQIAECIQQIRVHKRKRDFMSEFAQSPVDFIEKWTIQQIKDHKVISSGNVEEEEETRHSSFYYQPFVEDVVHHYVQNMIITQEK